MIGRTEKMCFAAGDLGFNFVWQSIELYLLFFYITVVGLSAETAAAVFLAGTIVDWLADPVIGILVDLLSPRISVRTWVVLGGPLSGLALAVVFAQPVLQLARGDSLAYALAAHVALRICYSLGNIPYGALTARISPDPRDRIALTSARMQGAALGGIIATSIFAVLSWYYGGKGASFAVGAVVLIVLAQPAFLATYLGVRERIDAPVSATRGSRLAADFARLLIRSGGLRSLLAIVFVAGISITVVNKSILFLFQEAGSIQLGFAATLLPSLSLLVSAPLWALAARRLGRQQVLVIAASLNLVAAVVLPVALQSPGLLVIAVMVAVVAGSGMSVMFWSFAPDVVDALERMSDGDACAARVFASVGIARKLAQALAPQFVTLGLFLSGGRSIVLGIVVVAVLTSAVIIAARPHARTRALPV